MFLLPHSLDRCSLWMFFCMKLNFWINELHERALRLFYQDYTFLFSKLLEKDSSTTMLNGNIQYWAIELCKAKIGVSNLLQTLSL